MHTAALWHGVVEVTLPKALVQHAETSITKGSVNALESFYARQLLLSQVHLGAGTLSGSVVAVVDEGWLVGTGACASNSEHACLD